MEDNKNINNKLFNCQLQTILIANVYCFSSQKRTFCYKINKEDKDLVGSLVKVSFGKKILFGVVMSVESFDVIDGDIKVNDECLNVLKVKTIESIIYKNLLNINFLDFLQKMAWYNVIHLERLMENVIFAPWMKKKRIIQISTHEKDIKTKQQNIMLNVDQQNISNNINTNGFSVSLLYGIMGSGKTYIFLDVVKRVLFNDNDSQVLIMVPEIALTGNLIKIVKDVCGITPIIWHSSISMAKKKVYFDNIVSGATRIVISTRSGLLLPYKKLSLIIIDEEHDTSYKQDEIPVYNARDMAILRAKYEDIPVILSSATPSVETILNVMKRKYKIFKINNQFFNTNPPKIEIINMLDGGNIYQNVLQNVEDKNGEKLTNYISKKAREAIISTLQKGEQSMVFINRRGYSRTLKCNDCGYEVKCQNCDNLLSYHKQQGVLKCHYCGYSVYEVKKCSHCGGDNLSANRGAGVEQIEKEVLSFCKAKTFIFSSDEIHHEKDIENIANEIKNGDVDVIIGTQIMTKGHHFPRLTNIVVLDIDGMCLDGDFRASERMFQLLFQLSGRAGREKNGATIFIQTNNTENNILKFIKNRDLRGFYLTEIQQRKKFNLPPFFRFISIIVSSTAREIAIQISTKILNSLSTILPKSAVILGPTESTMSFLKRNYRYRFLIKIDRKSDIFTALNTFHRTFIHPRNVIVKIDVDPYSFL